MTGVQAILSILLHCNLYGEIAVILSRLYMGGSLDPAGNLGPRGWEVESPSSQQQIPSNKDGPANQHVRSNSSSSNEQGL